ncbi:hypothetical protein CSB93_4443 [Pseudomonas paraeruginosa]|uniref:Uncharacterized protein n=1 Tax=Pseudomonas paraeruginosa TaxID=2994495 RepID=A0A2R3IPR8_9PSED|nr:hypothetical protein CSB93_4443 [Pseudomonas paraeruginosa]AWE89623.1 hypothetical protein CSC28_3233 [Pseudomonas paraeruginosa]PTC36572.1 hypothetical protein CLJ1_3065 [Pseudomonas aeruginosa]
MNCRGNVGGDVRALRSRAPGAREDGARGPPREYRRGPRGGAQVTFCRTW